MSEVDRMVRLCEGAMVGFCSITVREDALDASAEAAERLEGVAMAEPSIPVIANVDVTVHKTSEEIRAALARQACSAVQWVKTIEAMKAAGITDIVECGPGRVLVGLIRRIAPEIKTHNIYDQATLEKTLAALSN